MFLTAAKANTLDIVESEIKTVVEASNKSLLFSQSIQDLCSKRDQGEKKKFDKVLFFSTCLTNELCRMYSAIYVCSWKVWMTMMSMPPPARLVDVGCEDIMVQRPVVVADMDLCVKVAALLA